MTINNKSERNYRGKCLGCHVTSYGGEYIGLAPTDFNKNKVFYRFCMWLTLSQILKKITEGNARKPAFIYSSTLTSQKSEKHAWDTRGYSFKHALI